MKQVSRVLGTVFILALLGIAVTQVFASRDKREGRSLARWLLVEMRRAEVLENRATEMSQSLQVKKEIVGDLVAERLTLREAAEQFRQADQLIEDDREGLIADYHTPETEKGLYQQVISWAKSELSDDPRQADQIIPRLEQEMAEECRPDGCAE
jgi:hypothetical protein